MDNLTVEGGGFAPDIALEDDIPQPSYFGIEGIAADPVDANVVYVAAGMYAGEPAAIRVSLGVCMSEPTGAELSTESKNMPQLRRGGGQ